MVVNYLRQPGNAYDPFTKSGNGFDQIRKI